MIGGSTVSTDMTNIGLNGRLDRDNLNITNSLIISNSQILFQDMGNGKIIPMPFGQAMGTIQPSQS